MSELCITTHAPWPHVVCCVLEFLQVSMWDHLSSQSSGIYTESFTGNRISKS